MFPLTESECSLIRHHSTTGAGGKKAYFWPQGDIMRMSSTSVSCDSFQVALVCFSLEAFNKGSLTFSPSPSEQTQLYITGCCWFLMTETDSCGQSCNYIIFSHFTMKESVYVWLGGGVKCKNKQVSPFSLDFYISNIADVGFFYIYYTEFTAFPC